MSSSRNVSVEEEAEDEVYQPDNVALNQSSSDPDPAFFNNIMNDSVMLQQLLDSDNFQMPGLPFVNTAAWNQGGGDPNFQGGGNPTFQGGGGNPNYFQGE